MGEEMSGTPKRYDSNGYQYDLVHSDSTRRLEGVNEAIQAANTIGLWTMVVPGTSESFGDPIYYLYYYNRSRIEV